MIQHSFLSDVESVNLFLLTTEATWEFHVPEFGDLDRWAEPVQRCAVHTHTHTHLVVCTAKSHPVSMSQGHPFSSVLPSSHRSSTIDGTDVGLIVGSLFIFAFSDHKTEFPRMTVVQLPFHSA